MHKRTHFISLICTFLRCVSDSVTGYVICLRRLNPIFGLDLWPKVVNASHRCFASRQSIVVRCTLIRNLSGVICTPLFDCLFFLCDVIGVNLVIHCESSYVFFFLYEPYPVCIFRPSVKNDNCPLIYVLTL